MTHCTQLSLGIEGRRDTQVHFDAQHTTSDAGVVLLSRVDRKLKLSSRLSDAILDPRDPLKTTHELKTLLLQRMLLIAQGWQDCDDADWLRADPAYKWACGRPPLSGADLASQPTLSRVENLVTERDLDAMTQTLFDLYLERQPRKRRLIILDADVTDAETHGHQQLAFFNGYYGHTCLTPLLMFDGRTGDLLAVKLRPGNAGPADGLTGLLSWVVPQLRRRWPKAKILVRADSGFATPAIFALCEELRLDYLIAMKGNPNLEKLAVGELEWAKYQGKRRKVQWQAFGSGVYRSSGWATQRRVFWKAESGPYATDVRFVVTNLLGTSRDLYRKYVARGESENWIKAFKVALHGDRMSCKKATANQFRLLLHAAAYQLMLEFRRYLAGTVAESWQFDTLRLRLLKVGGWVQESVRRVVFHLSASHPHQELWVWLSQRLVPI